VTHWTGADRAWLRTACAARQTVSAMASALGRTEQSVRNMLSRCGLSARPTPLSTPVLACQPAQTLLDAFLRKPSGTPLVLQTSAHRPPRLVASRPVRDTSQHRGVAGKKQRWTAEELSNLSQQVLDGYSNAEIATVHGISAGALANTLFRYEIRRPGRQRRRA